MTMSSNNKTLSMHEELMLLALRDEKGTLESRTQIRGRGCATRLEKGG
jgi:hypothetical protein